MSIRAGQVYRDIYYDNSHLGWRHRTIKIVRVMGDKALALTITDVFGGALPKPRKTRVSAKTLAKNYELVAEPA